MKAQRAKQLASRQAPYKVANLYVIEGRDKWWEWRPSKTIDGSVITWGCKRDAEDWIKLQSSQIHPGKDILVRSEQRYRIRKIELLPSSAKGTFVTLK